MLFLMWISLAAFVVIFSLVLVLQWGGSAEGLATLLQAVYQLLDGRATIC